MMCLCMCRGISLCLRLTFQSAAPRCLALLFFLLGYFTPLQLLFSFSLYPFVITCVSFFLPPSSLHPYYYPVLCCTLCYHRNASVSLLAQSIKSLKDFLHSFIPFSISMSSPIELPSSFSPSFSYSFALFSVNELISFHPGAQQIRRYCIMAKTGKAPFCP